MESFTKCSICTNNPFNNVRVAEKPKVYVSSGKNTFYSCIILALFSFSHAADSKFNSVLSVLTRWCTWFKQYRATWQQEDGVLHCYWRTMSSFLHEDKLYLVVLFNGFKHRVTLGQRSWVSLSCSQFCTGLLEQHWFCISLSASVNQTLLFCSSSCCELPDVKMKCINNELCTTLAFTLINEENNEKKWRHHKYLMVQDLVWLEVSKSAQRLVIMIFIPLPTVKLQQH